MPGVALMEMPLAAKLGIELVLGAFWVMGIIMLVFPSQATSFKTRRFCSQAVRTNKGKAVVLPEWVFLFRVKTPGESVMKNHGMISDPTLSNRLKIWLIRSLGAWFVLISSGLWLLFMDAFSY
jgi:hypothetical protein